MPSRRRPEAGVVVAMALSASLAAACSAGRPSAPGSAPAAEAGGTVLRADQTAVSGSFTTATVAGVSEPLPLPVTITIPNRGQGGMTIRKVSAGTVVWDGGQPLPLSGTGTLDLGLVTATVDAHGTTWHLDGTPRFLTPGSYHAGSTVAVGTGGLARPADQATFTVAAGAEGQVETVGGAEVHTPPAQLSFRGPGSVVLTGTMTVRTAAGSTAVHRVQFDHGPFELGLVSAAVTALLQGPVVTN